MRRVSRFGSFLLVLLMVFGLAVVLGLVAGGPRSPPWFSAVSVGKGYEELLQVAAQINGRTDDGKGGDTNLVKGDDRTFQLVSSALDLPFEMPLRMYSISNTALPDLSSFKSVALALRVKGREAEQRGDNANAGTIYRAIITMGQHIEHGPLIALLVGIAIEKIGLDAIEKLDTRLSPEQRKDLANQLDTLDKQRLPFSEILLREHYFAHRITSNPVRLLLARFQSRTAMQKAEKKEQNLSTDFKRVAEFLRRTTNESTARSAH